MRLGSRTTPGVSSVKSKKLRPLIGRLETASDVTAVDVCDLVVSTAELSAVTVTASDVAPISICRSTVATAPTSSGTAASLATLNPFASTVKS